LGAWIVASDVTPGIPDRLVRVCQTAPRGFLAVFVEDAFGAARPIRRYQHVLDVTEVVLREPVDVIGRAFGFGQIVIELRTTDPFLGIRSSQNILSTSGARSRAMAFPCEESRGAEQRFADESVDRAVDGQGEWARRYRHRTRQ